MDVWALTNDCCFKMFNHVMSESVQKVTITEWLNWPFPVNVISSPVHLPIQDSIIVLLRKVYDQVGKNSSDFQNMGQPIKKSFLMTNSCRTEKKNFKYLLLTWIADKARNTIGLFGEEEKQRRKKTWLTHLHNQYVLMGACWGKKRGREANNYS